MSVLQMNVAAFLYKIEIHEWSIIAGVVFANNENGCAWTMEYLINDGEFMWTRIDVEVGL